MIDIERLAREAGLIGSYGQREIAHDRLLQRFASLVLEEAAKVCDDEAGSYRQNQTGASDGRYDWKEDSARDCADAIRSLKTDSNEKLT